MLARKILEHALASDAGLRIFAGRVGGHVFAGTAAVHGHEGIDASGRERDDPGASETLRNQSGDVRIHRPGQRQVALGAEFAPGHEHDVGNFGQRLDGIFIEQVAIDGLDATRLQPVLHASVAKARHADDPPVGQGGLGKARQRRPHLAGNTQNHDVAIHLAEIVDQRLARAAEQFVESGDIGNRLRQIVTRQQHVSSPIFLISA